MADPTEDHLRGRLSQCTIAGTEVFLSAVAHNIDIGIDWHIVMIGTLALIGILLLLLQLFNNNNNNKRPLTPKSMPPAGDEHAKLKT